MCLVSGEELVLLLFLNVLRLGTWLREQDILSQWKKLVWSKLFFSTEKNTSLTKSFSLLDENILNIFVLQ